MLRTVPVLLGLLAHAAAFSVSPQTASFMRVKSHSCLRAARTSATCGLQMSAHRDEAAEVSRRQVTGGAAAIAAGLLLSPAESALAKEKGMYPMVGDESIMKPKAHGTTEKPVQQQLRWGCDVKLADNICSFNRDFAEFAGYFETTSFLKEMPQDQEVTFYDSVTGKPLFIAPRGRSYKQFVFESKIHGWPSFRDQEVVWENVRCLADGESVSVDGTHLGHNLPDRTGNRYCINLVSIAGLPPSQA